VTSSLDIDLLGNLSCVTTSFPAYIKKEEEEDMVVVRVQMTRLRQPITTENFKAIETFFHFLIE
jgi:hypothetical protein